jgi:symplekin
LNIPGPRSSRKFLTGVPRHPNGQPFTSQIHDAIALQNARMEKATADEKARKYALLESNRKRQQPPTSTPSEEPSEPKRPKLEHESDAAATASFLATVDFTQLPASLITDLVVANLQAFTEPTLLALIHAYRQNQVASAPVTAVAGPSTEIQAPTPIALPVKLPDVEHEHTPEVEAVTIKEPVDPLKMDIDEVDLEYEPDRLNQEVSRRNPVTIGREAVEFKELMIIFLKLSSDGEMIVTGGEGVNATIQVDLALGDGETVGGVGGIGGGLQMIDFKLPPPREFPEEDRDLLIRESVTRIWACGSEFAEDASSADLWMLLVVRLVTRLMQPPLDEAAIETEKEKMDESEGKTLVDVNFYGRQDRMRQTLCTYVMEDFHSR